QSAEHLGAPFDTRADMRCDRHRQCGRAGDEKNGLEHQRVALVLRRIEGKAPHPSADATPERRWLLFDAHLVRWHSTTAKAAAFARVRLLASNVYKAGRDDTKGLM